MKAPPEKLGEFSIVAWAAVESDTVPTGNCTHRSPQADGDFKPAGLALVRASSSPESDACYLFHCDKDWNVVHDTWHLDLQEATDQAEFEFAGISVKWIQSA